MGKENFGFNCSIKLKNIVNKTCPQENHQRKRDGVPMGESGVYHDENEERDILIGVLALHHGTVVRRTHDLVWFFK